MMVEDEPTPIRVMQHKDWCQDPNCGNTLAHIEVDQASAKVMSLATRGQVRMLLR